MGCVGQVLVSSTSVIISPCYVKVVHFLYRQSSDRVNEFSSLRDVGNTYLTLIA